MTPPPSFSKNPKKSYLLLKGLPLVTQYFFLINKKYHTVWMLFFCNCVHGTFHKLLSCFDLPMSRKSTMLLKLFSVADWSQHNTILFFQIIGKLNGWPCRKQTLPDTTPSPPNTITVSFEPNKNHKMVQRLFTYRASKQVGEGVSYVCLFQKFLKLRKRGDTIF